MNTRMGARFGVLLLTTVLLLPSCGGPQNKHRDVGAVLGGVAGGIIGHQFGKGTGKAAATIVGVLVGAAVGHYIGERMDAADRAELGNTLEYHRTGERREWINPDTQAHYKVTPTRTYEAEPGRYCREFTTTIQVGGEAQQGYGTACRQPDGTWKIVNMDE